MYVVSALSLLAVFAPEPRVVGDRPSAKDLLARGADYVRKFEQDFSTVISLELYEQRAEQRRQGMPRASVPLSSLDRTLRSEMLFTRLPGGSWLTVRNVRTVDGKPIADSEDRLERALTQSGSARLLRALADEGARFNIGRIRRNVNDPTLALRFLSRDLQEGFKFSLAGREPIDGVDAWKLSYAERGSPSLVRGSRNEDLPATGAIWLSVDGTVLRTSFGIADNHTRLDATNVVDYARDAKLEMWVPVRMSETYVQRIGSTEERIVCTATYSDFRRFETSARVIGIK